MVLYVVMIALMVIVRRQWMDHERLIYPIMQLPIEMIRGEGGNSLVNPFFKNKLMWLGFAVPFAILSVNALHDYFPFFPEIDLTQRHLIFRNREELFIYIVFSMIGFTYFVNLNIAFSLWFFNLLFKLQKGYMGILGWTVSERLGPYSPGRSPIFIHQDMGAMIALVLVGLWISRRHLHAVLRKAWTNDRPWMTPARSCPTGPQCCAPLAVWPISGSGCGCREFPPGSCPFFCSARSCSSSL